jgi:hypothetical protein
MNDKKKNQPAQVLVQGKLTGQIDGHGAEHQVYRYHVNILNQDRATPREYDNEIHIFKSVTKPDTETGPANTAPCRDDIATAIAQHERSAKPCRAGMTAGCYLQRFRQVLSAALAGLSVKRHLATLPRLTFSIKRPRLPVIKLPSLKLKPGIFKNMRFKRLPLKRAKQPATDKTKLPPREKANKSSLKLRLAERINRKNLIRLCLPCMLLTTAAIIVYYLPWKNTNKEKIIYPLAQTKSRQHSQLEKDYRAVIEKTGKGVVITLQGPDHEEVLTKLPPGYVPVVEGNKIVHVVTPGNTLWFIAMRYIKNPYRYPELARLNHIKNPDLIFPGDKVIIQYIRKP